MMTLYWFCVTSACFTTGVGIGAIIEGEAMVMAVALCILVLLAMLGTWAHDRAVGLWG